MNDKIDSKNEKVLFISTILLLFMCGLAFDYDINKGLFEETIVQPTIVIEQSIEQFSPAQPIDFMPISLGLIIILLVILRKENIINMKKTVEFFNKITKTVRLFTRNYIIHHAKRISKKAAKIHSIDLARVTHQVSKLRPHKKLKEYYHENLKHNIKQELIKTRDLLTKPYEEKYTDSLVAIVFIFAVVGMAIFAVTPFFNPSIVSVEKPVITNIIVQEPEMLSPAEPIISALSLFLAITIITAVSILKLKKKPDKI